MATDSYPRPDDRSPSACAQREEHWRRILERHRQSGLTATAFCEREKLQPWALSTWGRRLREMNGAESKPATKKTLAKKPRRASFVPVRVIEAAPAAAASESAIELVTENGHVLRIKPGFDPATLRRAVAALEGRPC